MLYKHPFYEVSKSCFVFEIMCCWLFYAQSSDSLIRSSLQGSIYLFCLINKTKK